MAKGLDAGLEYVELNKGPMSIFEFLKPKSGLSEAKQRAKEVEKQMKWLLKQDPRTFKAGLKKLGLNEGDEEYKQALKIYEETS